MSNIKEFSIQDHIDMCYKMHNIDLDSCWKAHQEQLRRDYKNQLKEQNKQKINNEEFSNIIITNHAIKRIKERAGLSNLNIKNDDQVKDWIKERLVHSKLEEVEPIQKFKSLQILNHNFERTRYFRDANGMIYVIVSNVLKTVHRNEAKRYHKIS